MKLISFTLLGENFRSLPANYPFFKLDHEDPPGRLSTKCLAGLNGSGKSNLLEAVAEVFAYLERHLLEKGDQKRGIGLGFDLQYQLPATRTLVKKFFPKDKGIPKETVLYVKVAKYQDEAPEFSVSHEKSTGPLFTRADANQKLLLPNYIVGYSSGHNELLSHPFQQLKYHYWQLPQNAKTLQLQHQRMFFVDGDSNKYLLLANFLMGKSNKQKLLNQVYGVTGLHSFRITINLHDAQGKEITFSEFSLGLIQQLKSCATLWDEQAVYEVVKKKKGKNQRKQLILDYLVTPATQEAFHYFFEESAMEFYQALAYLETLNLQLYPESVLQRMASPWRKESHLGDLPELDPNERVFRVESIRINKIVNESTGATTPIPYRHLSDGEHQFNQIIGTMMLLETPGCLLLLDEPDTHFNPKWRSRLLQLLHHMAAKDMDDEGGFTEVLQQEVILTTHSPFAISDSYREDVYLFEKNEGKITVSKPPVPTFGASTGVILEHVFKKDHTIAHLAHQELEAIKAMATSLQGIEKARERLYGFGESIEKYDAIRYLRAREKELKSES